MLCGLLRNPGFGIKPQAAILGGDGVSVRKDSALVVSSDAATPPPLDGMEEDEAEEAEEEDREVTSASGAVCTFGVSTASSASMRKFLDFSIWFPVRCASLRLLQLLQTVNGVEVLRCGGVNTFRSYDVVRSVRELLRITLNPC